MSERIAIRDLVFLLFATALLVSWWQLVKTKQAAPSSRSWTSSRKIVSMMPNVRAKPAW